MKLLLDTHILIWISLDMLPRAAEKYILDEFNQLYFSPANIWEIVIKRGIGRADFNVDPHMLYSALCKTLVHLNSTLYRSGNCPALPLNYFQKTFAIISTCGIKSIFPSWLILSCCFRTKIG